jgi:hypothetical protein
MSEASVRYSYMTGSVGLVALRQRRLPSGGWRIEKFRYLGRGTRAQCIIRLLRARGRAA